MRLIRTAFYLIIAAMLFSSCEKDSDCGGSSTRNYDKSGFERLSIGDAMDVTVRKGNQFDVKAVGCSRDLHELRLQMKAGNTLDIGYSRSRNNRERTRLEITMPALIAANFSGATEAIVSGFEGGTTNLRIVLSGASKATLEGTTAQTQFDLSGASKLTTRGNTEKLYGSVSGASELHAFETAASEVDIHLSGASKANVKATNKLFAEASGASRLRYRGNPNVRDISTSGGSEVVAD